MKKPKVVAAKKLTDKEVCAIATKQAVVLHDALFNAGVHFDADAMRIAGHVLAHFMLHSMDESNMYDMPFRYTSIMLEFNAVINSRLRISFDPPGAPTTSDHKLH